MPSIPVRRHVARTPLMISLLFAATSCLTSTLWQNTQNLKGKKVTAALLTPVTLAIDAALMAGLVYVGASGVINTNVCEQTPTVYAPGRVILERR